MPITKSIKPAITKKNLYSVKYLTGVKWPIIPKTPMITAITHKIFVGADSFILYNLMAKVGKLSHMI